MKKTTSDQYVIRRYSVRASITLWMVLAGLFWVTLGLAVTYASHWGSDSMEATGHRLSTIAPAAGGGRDGREAMTRGLHRVASPMRGVSDGKAQRHPKEAGENHPQRDRCTNRVPANNILI